MTLDKSVSKKGNVFSVVYNTNKMDLDLVCFSNIHLKFDIAQMESNML